MVYFDNWYTSVGFAEKMCREKPDVVGTYKREYHLNRLCSQRLGGRMAHMVLLFPMKTLEKK